MKAVTVLTLMLMLLLVTVVITYFAGTVNTLIIKKHPHFTDATHNPFHILTILFLTYILILSSHIQVSIPNDQALVFPYVLYEGVSKSFRTES
jgi:phage-related holin